MSGMMGGDIDAPFTGDPAAAVVAQLTQKQTTIGPDGNPVPEGDRVPRDIPDPPEARRRLVLKWIDRVKADKKHHSAAFKRMRRNGEFVYGKQWQHSPGETKSGVDDTRYVANVAQRHVQQRTASLYATNPTVIAKKRERMVSTVWDGDMVTLQEAQQQLAQAAQQQLMQAQATGVPVQPGATPPGAENAVAILTDAKNQQGYDKLLKRMCKTLELLWDYNIQEQTFSFKSMMKLTVRRAIVTSVGYVKLGFQRAMKMNPEIETRIADMMQRLATADRLASDIADGVIPPEAAECEQLRLDIQALQQEPEIITREGLLFDYPDSTAIIPDKKTKSLRGFLGADWVTQEYLLTTEVIQEVYGVDVRKKHRVYTEDGSATSQDSNSAEYRVDDDDCDHGALCVVWEIYSRKDGLVYVVCDGYPDFLREPAAPEVYLDRFYPWFTMVFNEGYSEKELYPRSDIDLMTDMQLELNRARQGLREHRHANRPKMVTAAGMLEDEDKEKLKNHPANALIELRALQPGQKVEEVLQPLKMTPIDPALYDTNGSFEDILRVLGQDQASMGQTTSSSATEASVAQSAQHTDLSSVLDDQDEMLTEIAMAAGKIMLLNVKAETVQRVIGPGAVWPELTKQDVVENIYLTVRAGSTGRPNKQQEVMNAQILFPMLQRVPGISPEWMARELIKRMDDRLDLTEAFEAGVPSMDALNRIQGTVQTPPPSDPQNPQAAQNAASPPAPGGAAGAPPPQAGPGAPMAPPMGGAPNDPTAQGDNGGRNLQAPPPTNGLLGPRTPPVPGANGLMPGQGGGPRNTPQGALPVP